MKKVRIQFMYSISQVPSIYIQSFWMWQNKFRFCAAFGLVSFLFEWNEQRAFHVIVKHKFDTFLSYFGCKPFFFNLSKIKTKLILVAYLFTKIFLSLSIREWKKRVNHWNNIKTFIERWQKKYWQFLVCVQSFLNFFFGAFP